MKNRCSDFTVFLWRVIASHMITYSVMGIFALNVIGFSSCALNSKTFTKQQITSDIDYVVMNMEDIHPDLYASIRKEDFYNEIELIKDELSTAVNEIEAYHIFSRISSCIGDAHTSFAFTNYSKKGAILFKKVPPYRFRIVNSKLYVLENYSKKHRIPVGAEIVSINKKSISHCLSEIKKLVSYDNENHFNALIQIPIYWGLWNQFEDFEIAYATPENETQTILTSSGLFANLRYLRDFTGFGFSNYSFDILKDDIGYFNIKSFHNVNKFKTFAKDAFKEIYEKGINNILIDLRDNAGGNTQLAEELMQYISPISFNTFDTALVKISNELIRAYSLDTIEYKAGSLILESSDEISLRENPYRYSGKVYILTSSYTFSTAVDFAAMAKCFANAKIIGLETGGKTVSFGSPLKFILPETNLEIKVSCKRFVNACGVDNKEGVMPDIEMENSINNIIQGKDNVLEYATKFMKGD
jgi:hypothetical protein